VDLKYTNTNNTNNELKERVKKSEQALEFGVGNAALGVPG